MRIGRLVAVGDIVAGVAGRGRRVLHRAGRRGRFVYGRLGGLVYWLRRRHPDPTVDGVQLADRVRSTLGPIEKRRDLGHIHVMAEGHVVLLHGDVPTVADAVALEVAASTVPGVVAVDSHLHIGLLPSDERPSTGRARAA